MIMCSEIQLQVESRSLKYIFLHNESKHFFLFVYLMLDSFKALCKTNHQEIQVAASAPASKAWNVYKERACFFPKGGSVIKNITPHFPSDRITIPAQTLFGLQPSCLCYERSCNTDASVYTGSLSVCEFQSII